MPTLTVQPEPEQIRAELDDTGPARMSHRWLTRATFAIIAIAASVVCFGFLRFGRDVFGVGYEDDFYYYALVAHNLAFYGRSTFDGVHLTNGYHPLWLLLLTAIDAIFDPDGPFHPANAVPLAAALSAFQVLLVLAITTFAGRTLRLRCGPYTTASVQLLLATSAIVLARSGMEAGITVALGFGLLSFRLRPGFHWSTASALRYGLLGSAMILSRLDSILLVAMLLVLDVLPSTRESRTRLAFVAGLSPVAVYLGVNQWIFGTATPVSGTAKQLRLHHLPALHALRSFCENILNLRSPMNRFWVPLTLCALLLLLLRPGGLRAETRGVFQAILIFPLVHVLAVSTLSDWPVWGWYLYGWVLSGVVAVMVLLPRRTSDPAVGAPALGMLAYSLAVVCLGLFAFMIVTFTRRDGNPIYTAALDLERFAARHPGVYAMGDRAGAVAWLTRQPLVQVEGLTMDRGFLENLRAQRDLVQVLQHYGVRYYISTRAQHDSAGCYRVREPWQAGPDSPVMLGRLCMRPVLEIDHQGFINDVFDLQSQPPGVPNTVANAVAKPPASAGAPALVH
jgi:hypothetical protein